MDFKVGDYVQVVHHGRCYRNYDSWLIKNVTSNFLKENWAQNLYRKNNFYPFLEDGMRGTIMAIAPHENGEGYDTLAYFFSDDGIGYILGLNYDEDGERAVEKIE